ncbi:polysaccharide pyruvyl transferase family protein [Pedobacter helvus]|uniref:Polysaccharide pyruvyl transferase family protein n=1 Tax=Pedobacter helvus TaxID=2563444 RepID=A0ABW9JMX5_9SPHI|nr:polysaccharide pyruvyl transferase family protein [Pedobacter ureilyticus]
MGLINKIKNRLRPFYKVYKVWWSEKVGKKNLPEVINFNANDICNSKCTMCNIWQQKQDNEITSEQFQAILKDPLYQNVKHIGITGGEPTLREDLHLLYEAAIKALPNIQGLSIITNAIQKDQVIERIEKVIETCKAYNKQFSMMVSLDGYGKVHDEVRGRSGNFETAMAVIAYFKAKGLTVATGTTISKTNVWDVEELLHFFQKTEHYGRFRIAEFIKRLYNEDRNNVIRNFDDDEIYQLQLFFFKLISTYEKDPTYQRTYKSIINILSGGKRLIGCPYHSDGIVVSSRGELAYCAPKSNFIGNGLEESSLHLYQTNGKEKERIKKENCESCIHDYHYKETFNELKARIRTMFWTRLYQIDSKWKSIHRLVKPFDKTNNYKTAFIVGWYGTETVGDKAILAGIVHELTEKFGKINLYIGSLYPFITQRTIRELNITAKVIDVWEKDFIAACKSSDLIIMGGGPLMDLEVLSVPLKAFQLGKIYNKTNIIYGCGIGPLYNERYQNTVKKILSLSDEIMVRDAKSKLTAVEWTNHSKPVKLSGDPSKVYLKSLHQQFPQRNIISCYLRDWTYEYCRDLSYEDFLAKKQELELGIANLIKHKALEMQVDEIRLEHMHNFVIGNDDRDFSRYFMEKYFDDFEIPITYNKYLSTVISISESMQSSKLNVCMRFHSVVFAHSFNTNFVAVDYTKGGKIKNYLVDENQMNNYLSVDDIINNYANE